MNNAGTADVSKTSLPQTKELRFSDSSQIHVFKNPPIDDPPSGTNLNSCIPQMNPNRRPYECIDCGFTRKSPKQFRNLPKTGPPPSRIIPKLRGRPASEYRVCHRRIQSCYETIRIQIREEKVSQSDTHSGDTQLEDTTAERSTTDNPKKRPSTSMPWLTLRSKYRKTTEIEVLDSISNLSNNPAVEGQSGSLLGEPSQAQETNLINESPNRSSQHTVTSSSATLVGAQYSNRLTSPEKPSVTN